MIRISVIVLNWNGMSVIEECIDSLLAQDYPAFEIIIVDNGSTDGSTAKIEQKYQGKIQLIKNTKNLGFAEGCNVGIRASNAEFIALINSDAVVRKNWINEMVKAMDGDPSIGMAAGKIYFSGTENLIENTGHSVYRDGLGRGRGRLEKDTGQYDTNNRVFCPNGCAAFYRRKMMEEIGMFDKYFFAYADDIDVGFRGRLHQYECAYVPSAVAYHRLSSSFGLLSPFKAFLVERNRLWVLIKCFPMRHLLRAPFYTAARYFYHLYGLVKHIGPASKYAEHLSLLSLMGIAIRVYLSTLWFLPYLIIQRIKVQSRSKASSKDFDEWFKLYGLTARETALNEISY